MPLRLFVVLAWRPEAGFAGREANRRLPVRGTEEGGSYGETWFPPTRCYRAIARSTASASSGDRASEGRPRSSSFT
jgi:hypothetical protein